MERLQKVIAASGYTSRRKAEELILKGQVKVNNQIIVKLGYKVKDTDQITVEGKSLNREEKEYYLFYKPEKVVSTVKDNLNRKTVIDFIPTEKRIYPIGRLDYDTTGLILLTNDGELSNILMHPSYQVEKTYIAKVEGSLTGREFQLLKNGIMIEKRLVIPVRVKLRQKNKTNSKIEITITEGRNHIIKKIFDILGHPVMELKRESFAFLTLQGMKKGEVRKLTFKEVKKLYSYK